MKNIIKLFILILVLTLFLNRPQTARGDYESDMNQEIQDLNNKIAAQRKTVDDMQNKQKQYQQLISQKESEKVDLANQISLLDDQVEKSKLDIEVVQAQIDQTNLEVKELTLNIQSKDTEINNEKEHIASLLRLIYKQDQASTLEILLLNDSLTDFINQLKYLENTNDEITQSVEKLKDDKDTLEQNKATLVSKQTDLDQLKDTLETKQGALEDDQQAKNYVLDQTKQSEVQYQKLLAKSRQQQLQAENEISGFEKTVRDKIANSKNHVELNYAGLIWPSGKNTITTLFHDPDYPFRRVLGEHPGIDVKAAYGTTLRAAADGYVARVKFDGSSSYAYIMIVHGDGLSTVYGHVSSVSVSADEYVTQGQVIGKTGGRPGSPGSGPFTTGPHLHFEVRKNGIPVNPLDYLP